MLTCQTKTILLIFIVLFTIDIAQSSFFLLIVLCISNRIFLPNAIIEMEEKNDMLHLSTNKHTQYNVYADETEKDSNHY